MCHLVGTKFGTPIFEKKKGLNLNINVILNVINITFQYYHKLILPSYISRLEFNWQLNVFNVIKL